MVRSAQLARVSNHEAPMPPTLRDATLRVAPRDEVLNSILRLGPHFACCVDAQPAGGGEALLRQEAAFVVPPLPPLHPIAPIDARHSPPPRAGGSPPAPDSPPPPIFPPPLPPPTHPPPPFP